MPARKKKKVARAVQQEEPQYGSRQMDLAEGELDTVEESLRAKDKQSAPKTRRAGGS